MTVPAAAAAGGAELGQRPRLLALPRPRFLLPLRPLPAPGGPARSPRLHQAPEAAEGAKAESESHVACLLWSILARIFFLSIDFRRVGGGGVQRKLTGPRPPPPPRHVPLTRAAR